MLIKNAFYVFALLVSYPVLVESMIGQDRYEVMAIVDRAIPATEENNSSPDNTLPQSSDLK